MTLLEIGCLVWLAVLAAAICTATYQIVLGVNRRLKRKPVNHHVPVWQELQDRVVRDQIHFETAPWWSAR
jgi:hypothetical protein